MFQLPVLLWIPITFCGVTPLSTIFPGQVLGGIYFGLVALATLQLIRGVHCSFYSSKSYISRRFGRVAALILSYF